MTNAVETKWIEWNGGECPLSRYDIIQVKLRDGEIEQPRCACEFDWRHLPEDAGQDIVAYRVGPFGKEQNRLTPPRDETLFESMRREIASLKAQLRDALSKG